MPRLATILIAAVVALALTAGGATAGSLITGAKVKNSSLTGADVRDRSITTRDLAPSARGTGTLTKARAAQAVQDVLTDPQYGLTIKVQGERGEQGPAGQAVQGPQGPAGVHGVTVREQSVTVAPSSSAGIAAKCAGGERVVGGGGRFDGTAGILEDSYPVADSEQGWTAVYTNSGSTAGTATAYALCAITG